jgi:hypothetical protein
MVAVAVEGLLDAPCPRAGITVTGLGVGDSVVSVWRTADGVRSPVRGARRVIMVDSAFVTDYDAPLGRPVTYEVEVISGPGGASRTLSPQVTIDSPTGWIMDPLIPQSAVPVVANDGDGLYLRAQALTQLEYLADVSLIKVMGSSEPMALFGQRQAATGIDLSMGAETADHNSRLRQLLQSTAQLLFRPIPGFGVDLPGTMFVSVPSAVENPVDQEWGGSLTWWDLKADTVAAPTMKVLTSTYTWGDVALLFGTWQQKQDSAAGTYLDDLKTPLG